MEFIKIYLEDFRYWTENKKLKNESFQLLGLFLVSELGIGRMESKLFLDFLHNAIFIRKRMTFNSLYFYTQDRFLRLNEQFDDPKSDFIITPENFWELVLEWKKIVSTIPQEIYLVENNNHYSLYSGDDYEITTAADGTETLLKKTKE